MHSFRYPLPLALSVCVLNACSSGSTTPTMATGGAGGESTTGEAGSPSLSATGDAQTPPTTNGTDVEAWLATGVYENWACETASHPQMKVSPHGMNRICSNDLVANFTGGVGAERPAGSASVKELYDDSNTLVGYAVAVKLAAASDAGKNWYWYERVPLDSTAAPHDAKTGVVADGLGGSGTPLSICVSCHTAAGSDTTHTVTKSSDFVYDVAGG
jgi:hypothetical protein